MEITNNVNLNKRAISPSFGAIKYDGLEPTLRNILSLKELQEFKTIVQKHKDNKLVDVILFSNGKKLQANVADTVVNKGNHFRCKNYSNRLFESNMNFIKRMVRYMQERTPKVQELIDKQNFQF